jgi:hypothetical protein
MTDLSIARTKFLKQLGLMYSGTFIPHSQSRNRKKVKLIEKQLNWKINISRGGHKMRCDYSQGIAYCPSYKQGYQSPETSEALDWEVENGRHYGKNAEIALPPLEDVLYSLVMDYSVLDSGNFEEWADEYGYNKDSKAAERTYLACKDNSLMLRIIFGEDNIKKLQELFEDY